MISQKHKEAKELSLPVKLFVLLKAFTVMALVSSGLIGFGALILYMKNSGSILGLLTIPILFIIVLCLTRANPSLD